MPKYLCIQRNQPGKREKPPPQRMAEMHAAFNAWKEKFHGNIIDMGGALKGGGKIVTSEGAMDGPFTGAKEMVGGYMIISAESVEEAILIAGESPGVVTPGSSVEIREINAP